MGKEMKIISWEHGFLYIRPLDLFHGNEKELATDEEYNNKVGRQWSQKALHCRHPYDLSQQHVDRETSNKWLTSADLFAEIEGFLTATQDQIVPNINYKFNKETN
jgi:hypothetical protein